MEFVTGEQAAALTVPHDAVVRLGGKATVWVVADGRVAPREVTTGLVTAARTEIVRGLDAGTRVVVRGHAGLYAGARVLEVQPPTTAAVPPPVAPREVPKAPPAGGSHSGH